MQAWNSPEIVALRQGHLRKDVRGTVCESCIAYAGAGGCPSAMRSSGLFTPRPPLLSTCV